MVKFALFENHFKSCIGAVEGDSLGTKAQEGLPFTSPGTLEVTPPGRYGTKSSGVLIPMTRRVETPGVCLPPRLRVGSRRAHDSRVFLR